MGRYVFSSHDGFGLGHTRRNALIAREVARLDPTAEIVLVTGVQRPPAWLQDPRFSVVRVPSLLKARADISSLDIKGAPMASPVVRLKR